MDNYGIYDDLYDLMREHKKFQELIRRDHSPSPASFEVELKLHCYDYARKQYLLRMVDDLPTTKDIVVEEYITAYYPNYIRRRKTGSFDYKRSVCVDNSIKISIEEDLGIKIPPAVAAEPLVSTRRVRHKKFVDNMIVSTDYFHSFFCNNIEHNFKYPILVVEIESNQHYKKPGEAIMACGEISQFSDKYKLFVLDKYIYNLVSSDNSQNILLEEISRGQWE